MLKIVDVFYLLKYGVAIRGLPFSLEWGVINIRKYPGNIFATPLSARRNFYDPPIQELIFLWPPLEKK